jgi:hypothetical protein
LEECGLGTVVLVRRVEGLLEVVLYGGCGKRCVGGGWAGKGLGREYVGGFRVVLLSAVTDELEVDRAAVCPGAGMFWIEEEVKWASGERGSNRGVAKGWMTEGCEGVEAAECEVDERGGMVAKVVAAVGDVTGRCEEEVFRVGGCGEERGEEAGSGAYGGGSN